MHVPPFVFFLSFFFFALTLLSLLLIGICTSLVKKCMSINKDCVCIYKKKKRPGKPLACKFVDMPRIHRGITAKLFNKGLFFVEFGGSCTLEQSSGVFDGVSWCFMNPSSRLGNSRLISSLHCVLLHSCSSLMS